MNASRVIKSNAKNFNSRTWAGGTWRHRTISARGDNLPVAVGTALLPGRAGPVWPMRSLRKVDTVGSHSPKRGTKSSQFSPKSGTRNPWRRPTLRARGMPLAHECSGDRHYPYGSGFGNKEERRRENAGSEAASLRQPPISVANGRH